MCEIEIDILRACLEAEKRRYQMLPALAASLQISEEEVFYTWALRQCPQRGEVTGGPWVYFFHGLECEMKNTNDGRFLRFDFGPGGRVDTMTAWGVLQFIMTSSAPWKEFATLQELFAKSESPYGPYSGDVQKFGDYWKRLERQNHFEIVEPQLLQIVKKHSSVGEDGITHVGYPVGTSEREIADYGVAYRKRLSAQAKELLNKQFVQEKVQQLQPLPDKSAATQ